MSEIVWSHADPRYDRRGYQCWNGAYYYSVEIVDRIIPNVKTERPWVTLNKVGRCKDGAIVFIHNNLDPARIYAWLGKYKDLVLVCGIPETASKVKHLGRAIYVPISIDVQDVKKYETEKTEEVCFVGRPAKKNNRIPRGTKLLEAMPREKILAELAKYRKAYAVGRCALEAKALGCEILFYDPRFPDPNVWEVLDNLEAAEILQAEIDKIDK